MPGFGSISNIQTFPRSALFGTRLQLCAATKTTTGAEHAICQEFGPFRRKPLLPPSPPCTPAPPGRWRDRKPALIHSLALTSATAQETKQVSGHPELPGHPEGGRGLREREGPPAALTCPLGTILWARSCRGHLLGGSRSTQGGNLGVCLPDVPPAWTPRAGGHASPAL